MLASNARQTDEEVVAVGHCEQIDLVRWQQAYHLFAVVDVEVSGSLLVLRLEWLVCVQSRLVGALKRGL